MCGLGGGDDQSRPLCCAAGRCLELPGGWTAGVGLLGIGVLFVCLNITHTHTHTRLLVVIPVLLTGGHVTHGHDDNTL